MSSANLQAVDLSNAQLEGADLQGTQLQGADLSSAEILIVGNFPRDITTQSPAPLGLTDLKMLALTADAKAQLRKYLNANITDPKMLSVVIDRLDQVLRDESPNREDGNSWTERWKGYVSQAKEPSAEELAQFHAYLACDDIEGYIAKSMAGRAQEVETHVRGGYAKPFARALLNENCKGGKALTDEARAALEHLVSAPE